MDYCEVADLFDKEEELIEELLDDDGDKKEVIKELDKIERRIKYERADDCI